MRITIGRRVFLAITLASLIAVALFYVATRISFTRSFGDYLAEQDELRLQAAASVLEQLYAETGSWDALRQRKRIWDDLWRPGSHRGELDRPPPHGARPPAGGPPPHELVNRVGLFDTDGQPVAGRPDLRQPYRQLEVRNGSDKVGELRIAERTELSEAVDLRFSARQQRSTLLLGGVVLLISGLIAWLLARQLSRPILSLADATRQLTAGDFKRRITVAADDEVGDLARDFNSLASSLQRSRQLRRQWVSDIAHELRTPLSILDGELQAIEDGIRRFDAVALRSLQAETRRLGKLVADLHLLTTSDEGGLVVRKQAVDVLGILRDSVTIAQPRIQADGLTVSFAVGDDDSAIIDGDGDRLQQLFTNLIENSIRYTDTPGRLHIRATCDAKNVTLSLADSAPGVADADLPKLFDRLYPVDASRNRNEGGSGLGLAICAAIVTAHDGKISANHSETGGVEIVIQLPLKGHEE